MLDVEDNRILVCTPSNTAADLFAIELIETAKVDPKMLFRMYSLMRKVDDQLSELSDISCVT